jgi:uncharacterized membrane protein
MAIQSIRQSTEHGSEQRSQARGSFYERQGQEQWPQRLLQNGNTEQLTTALGWFSIALGLAEMVMPGRFAEMIGISPDQDSQQVVRAVGLRELVSGIGILAQANSAGWVKARVGGDAMDLALLGAALSSRQAQPERVRLAMAAVAGVTVLDVLCARQLSRQAAHHQQPTWQQSNWQQTERAQRTGARAPSVPHERGIHVTKTITINRSAEELYDTWRDFTNLPRIMRHLESVTVSEGQQSHWRAKAPAGMKVEWDAEIIDDTPGERISWRSLAGSGVPNAGSVRFKPATGGRGTVVTVELEYQPPGGALGAVIAKLFGEEPEQQVQEDLRRFKQVMETGEVVRSDATIRGAHLAQRPAQPPEPAELERVKL